LPDFPGGHGQNAVVQALLGQGERALASAERCLELSSSIPLYRASSSATSSLAIALASGGDYERARSTLDAALADSAVITVPLAVENLLVAYAVVAFLVGDLPRCSRLLSWARSRTFDAGRIMTSEAVYAAYRQYVGLVRRTVDPDNGRRYQSEGRAMSQTEAIACAQALETKC
jgi:hypothetical protein